MIEQRIVCLEGAVNFRDLGGYTGADGRRVRWRQLYRSGTTHLFNAAARERLAAMGIRAAVDLRSRQEQAEHPHAFGAIADFSYLSCNHDHVAGNLVGALRDPRLNAAAVREEMLQLYRELPYAFRDVLQMLFRSAALGPLPLVFNCAAGKDRTGVAAALLLIALGVDWPEVEADYLLTERCVPDIMRAVLASRMGRRLAAIDPQALLPLFGVDRTYLAAMRESVAARSGSFDNYFAVELALEPDLLAALRERLLG
jgi:protein-tyrosine phosphatase